MSRKRIPAALLALFLTVAVATPALAIYMYTGQYYVTSQVCHGVGDTVHYHFNVVNGSTAVRRIYGKIGVSGYWDTIPTHTLNVLIDGNWPANTQIILNTGWKRAYSYQNTAGLPKSYLKFAGSDAVPLVQKASPFVSCQ